MPVHNVNVAMWNIRGLATIRQNKLKDVVVKDLIAQHDILGTVESHTAAGERIEVDGYTTHHNPQPSIWIELQAGFFNLDKDLSLAFVYVEPNISKKADPMKHVRGGLERCPGSNTVVVGRDLNARVGNLCAGPTDISYNYVDDIPEEDKEPDRTWKRTIRDGGGNMYGMEINHMAIASGLAVLNGTEKDLSNGSLTCYAHPDHSTTIDLSMVSAAEGEMVVNMTVLPYYPDLSDHCPIFITLACKVRQEQMEDQSTEPGLPVELTKANWTREAKREVETSLHLEELKSSLLPLFNNSPCHLSRQWWFRWWTA